MVMETGGGSWGSFASKILVELAKIDLFSVASPKMSFTRNFSNLGEIFHRETAWVVARKIFATETLLPDLLHAAYTLQASVAEAVAE